MAKENDSWSGFCARIFVPLLKPPFEYLGKVITYHLKKWFPMDDDSKTQSIEVQGEYLPDKKSDKPKRQYLCDFSNFDIEAESISIDKFFATKAN